MVKVQDRFTLRISTINETTNKETLVFESKDNDVNQIIELEEGLLAFFGAILQKQKG